MKSIEPITSGIADVIAVFIIIFLALIFWGLDTIREKKKVEEEESSFRQYIHAKYKKYNLPGTKLKAA